MSVHGHRAVQINLLAMYADIPGTTLKSLDYGCFSVFWDSNMV